MFWSRFYGLFPKHGRALRDQTNQAALFVSERKRHLIYIENTHNNDHANYHIGEMIIIAHVSRFVLSLWTVGGGGSLPNTMAYIHSVWNVARACVIRLVNTIFISALARRHTSCWHAGASNSMRYLCVLRLVVVLGLFHALASSRFFVNSISYILHTKQFDTEEGCCTTGYTITIVL